MLERTQADLVGLVGEVSDLDEEILELRRKVSVVPEPEDMDDSDGSTPRVVMRKKPKARACKWKTVKIVTDSSTKILKLAQGLSHGDLLKLAKRLEMALDSVFNAASSKDIETKCPEFGRRGGWRVEHDLWVVFWQRGAEFHGRQLIKDDLKFLDPSLLPGASVSSSVKTDGFCSGAAGPVFLFSVSCFSGMLCGRQTLEFWISRISSSTRRAASWEW